MRIFYCLHNHNWEDENLYPALVEMGHDVVKFDWGVGAAWKQDRWEEEGKPKLNEDILRRVRGEHRRKPIGLFFGYLNKFLVYRETIEEIKKLGIPTVNFSCNDAHQFHLVDEIAPVFDWCMFTIRSTGEKFRKVGAKPVYIQLAANPHTYRPYPLEREFDVTFVGQRYGDRADHIKYVAEQGIDVRVWGRGWNDNPSPEEQLAAKLSAKSILSRALDPVNLLSLPKKGIDFVRRWGEMRKDSGTFGKIGGGEVGHEELVKMYSRSKISLGFMTCGDTHRKGEGLVRQIRLRDFEAPMSGCFYLTEYFDELEGFYDIGKEMVCYRSKEDLVEKINYYLEHPDEREKIRAAGYERAQRDHTWVRRFEEFFKETRL